MRIVPHNKIYDDILDDEETPDLLPVANSCLRITTAEYYKILTGKYASVFEKIMSKMEYANSWERNLCYVGIKTKKGMQINQERIPIYDKEYTLLAHKSLPHALGPITLLLQNKPDSISEIQSLINFFKHYLIARQLNDDAHDWYQDLEKGFINSVGSQILHTFFEKNGDGKIQHIYVSKEKESLHQFFWKNDIEEILTDIDNHIQMAKTQLKTMSFLTDQAYFLELLQPLERAIYRTKTERHKVTEFLLHS
jgi:hypothetical protein